MAKKTLSYFSVIDFFGFRLAIPFENPLSLCAAVIHAMLYPQRSQSDELGTLSMQIALHAPGALLNVVHSLPADLDAAFARRISNHPWQFPLSLSPSLCACACPLTGCERPHDPFPSRRHRCTGGTVTGR